MIDELSTIMTIDPSSVFVNSVVSEVTKKKGLSQIYASGKDRKIGEWRGGVFKRAHRQCPIFR
jgi:hypothetical protein